MAEINIAKGPFEPSFESLRQYECPEWFKDAKLGIWSHWGPQSVPMYGDWYARAMYYEGSEQYRYHIRRFGHPSEFGYKDIIRMWKAEKFDPEALMDLYAAAGAKYFVSQAMHHDNFFNYNSGIHRWNSVNMGPHKDIVALWKAAAVRKGLPFGLTEHMGATFTWWAVNKGCDREGLYAGIPYDGSDPAYEDLYLPNHEHYDPDEKLVYFLPYTGNQWWRRRWLDVIKEVIDLYQPELLYIDGVLPFGDNEAGVKASMPVPTGVDEICKIGLQAAAHLYNTSAALHGGVNRAVLTQKDRRREVYSVGVLDMERSQAPDIRPDSWQACSCVGGWFYDVRQVYKTPGHVIEMLVDIISKNGNLLLNIPQKPDGTLDSECIYILKEMAKWNKICSEGVYGTRPFRVAGEGPSGADSGGQAEKAVEWTASDFRFTGKGNMLYAFQMKWPQNNKAVISSLLPGERVKRIRLLGAGEVTFERQYHMLTVNLPERKPTQYVNCLAIELEK